jgi:HSP20 family protein
MLRTQVALHTDGVQQPQEIKASMENGILTVSFPKTTAEQTAKSITIN